MPFNRALMLTGPTQSGKSTFLDVVAALLGADNVARESLQQLANNRFSPAELDGKFVNIRSDLDSSIVRNTGRFKELAAGDAIRAERKNQDPFRFRVTQKQLYATNQVPDVDNVDQAFHERWLHVRFPDTIPRDDRDGEIDQKLTTDDELVGILNWALDGYARLMNQDGFSNERSISGKRDLWQSQGDSIDRFVDQVLVKDEQGREPDVEVYNAYCEFCDSLERQPKAKATLTKRLKQEYGVEQRRPTIGNEQVRCYCGISFGSTLPVASSPGT
jgi:putative DNA primase/helicase